MSTETQIQPYALKPADGRAEDDLRRRRALRCEAGEFVFGPRGTPHSYIVTSERTRLLATFSPAGVEAFFVEYGVRDDGNGARPAGDDVLPPREELVRAFARYGAEIVGPPPTLAELGLLAADY